jgi:hypothetical protein
MTKHALTHSTNSSNLADLLERVLDKGVVIAGDIKIKLVEIELLTIQIRLVICSVERAMAMGMDWWRTDPNWSSLARGPASPSLAKPELDPPSQITTSSVTAPAAEGTSILNPLAKASPGSMEDRLRDLERQLARIEQRIQIPNETS